MALAKRCGYDMGRQRGREGTDVMKNDVDCRWIQRNDGHGLMLSIQNYIIINLVSFHGSHVNPAATALLGTRPGIYPAFDISFSS